MADTTLAEAARRFIGGVKDSSRQPAIAELNRFMRWYGPDRPVNQMRGHDVAQYAEMMGPASSETSRRANHVRAFLAFLKKEELTKDNLAAHLRLKKSTRSAAGSALKAEDETVELTGEGIEALKKELESLVAMRPAVREEIRSAMLDKDFRENSPLDVAKEKQGHMEARIREIEAMLKRAVVVDESANAGRVRVGTSVTVKNVKTGAVERFNIVGPTEANAADGKISSVSPVGKALLGRRAGDEVEVSAPAGVMRFQIESIEA
jgi:transcription elongation factor GreA